MVVKILRYLQKEFNGLHEAAFLLGFFALLSQIIAVVRDRLFAGYFGAGAELDIYYAAFRVPDIIFVSVASLVAITVVMPFFIEKVEKDKETARRFINSVFTVFFIVILIVSVVAFFALPYIIKNLMSFDEQTTASVVLLSRILLLSPILLGISNIFASITQAFQNFLTYALSPVLYNVGIVIGLLFLYPYFGISGLAFGVVLGALFHVGIQLPVIINRGFLPKPSLRIHFSEIKEVVSLALPRTIGLSAQQIALFILVALASAMMVGSISVFQLAFNLQSVPLAIVGVSYSVAVFPTLARLHSKKKIKKFVDQVLTAVRHIIFWSLPITFLFIVLRAQIVRVILGAKEFDWWDTQLTTAILALFAVSVVAQSLVVLFVRAFYAAGKTKIPVIVNVVSASFIVVFAYMFIGILSQYDIVRYFVEALLRVDGIEGSSVLALPFAYSTGMILNVVLLWLFFKREFKILNTQRIQRTFRHSLYSAFAIGTVAYFSLLMIEKLLIYFDLMFVLDTFIGIFLQGAISGVLGIVAGAFILIFVGNDEIHEIRKAVRNRFWKTKAILPDKVKL